MSLPTKSKMVPASKVSRRSDSVLMEADRHKEAAAAVALEQVTDGMRLGIGTGSTAEAFIRLLARRCADGLAIVGVPTSERTAALCLELGIPLTTLEDTPRLDLTVDGADEIGPGLTLVKGGGGALLREKIVAAASNDMTVIADASKRVEFLGRFPLPIEINRFGMRSTMAAIERSAARIGLRGRLDLRGDASGQPFLTDGGHLIVDASFGRIPDPETLSAELHAIPGVVEHGLFIGLAGRAVIAGPQGTEVLLAARS